MTYTKRVVVLAKSFKHGGTCVAGKELNHENKPTGQWVRPIGPTEGHALSHANMRCNHDGALSQVAVLDVVDILMLEHKPDGYQSENHLIDDSSNWTKKFRATSEFVEGIAEADGSDLWLNGDSTKHGLNDQMHISKMSSINRSLELIKVETINIHVYQTKYGGKSKRHWRAEFTYGANDYGLNITDPAITNHYVNDGTYGLDNVILCLSLAEPFNDHAYKLVAAVIVP